MAVVARGKSEVMAFWAMVQHGNHNNIQLIDRVVHQAGYDLAVVSSEAFMAISRVGDDLRAAIDAEREHNTNRCQPA